METKYCKHCGQPIPDQRYNGKPLGPVRYSRREFCNIKCRRAYREIDQETRFCEECGGPIPKAYSSGRPMSPAHYRQRVSCSLKCQGIRRKKLNAEIKQHSGRPWEEWPLSRPTRPTQAMPGTPEKIEAMRARVARGEAPLYYRDAKPCLI